MGAGVIGLEYATIFATLGVRVTLIDQRRRLLPFVDAEIIDALIYHMRDNRVTLRLSEGVRSVAPVDCANGPRVAIMLESGKKVIAEKALYCIGRSGATARLGLENAGLQVIERGLLSVSETFQTKVPHIYAAGDVIGFPSLASTSMEQGRQAACHAFGIQAEATPDHFPYGIYTIPEISTVGKNEEELTQAGVPYEVGRAAYKEIARGQIIGDTTGLLKLMFHCETRKLLGVSILGEGASELVHIDEPVDVMVLDINQEKQEISLGMKQTQSNPWDKVADRYPPGALVKGRVRNLTNYGAFVEIEEGIDGLLHVSDMSWTRKISHPSEVVEKAQTVECKVLSVDQQRRRIALGLKQLEEDPWATDIPSKYQPGQLVTGTVTKITNFGVFVGLENGLEGLLHISELADHKVENAEELVKVGDQIEVKVLRVDAGERKIGLSKKRVDWAEEDEAEAAAAQGASNSSTSDLKGGVGGDSGPLIKQ